MINNNFLVWDREKLVLTSASAVELRIHMFNNNSTAEEMSVFSNKEPTCKRLLFFGICSYLDKKRNKSALESWKVLNKHRASDASFALCMLRLLDMASEEDEMCCIVMRKHSTWWRGNKSQHLPQISWWYGKPEIAKVRIKKFQSQISR